MVRIEREQNRVGLRDLGVPDPVPRDDRVRIPIPGPHADVDGRVVVHETDFGAFGRRLPIERFALDEIRHDGDALPGRVVQHSIDHGRLSRTGREALQRRGRLFFRFMLPRTVLRPQFRRRDRHGDETNGAQAEPTAGKTRLSSEAHVMHTLNAESTHTKPQNVRRDIAIGEHLKLNTNVNTQGSPAVAVPATQELCSIL